MRSVSAQLSGSEGHINRFSREQGGGGGSGGGAGGGGGAHSVCCGGAGAVVALTSLDNSKSSIFLVVPQTDAEIQSITSSDSQKESRTRNRSCSERDANAI